jgi:hypothetical protein
MNILIKLTSIVALIIAPHIAVNKDGHTIQDHKEVIEQVTIINNDPVIEEKNVEAILTDPEK